MHVEKRATNKIGIILLAAVVIALLVGGGYYLYKHKGSLNIDWNAKLPWSKDEKKEHTKKFVKDQAGKQNKNQSFVAPLNVTKSSIDATYCHTTVTGMEDKPKEIIVKFKVTNVNEQYPGLSAPCRISIYQIAVDTFAVPGNAEISLETNETKDMELVIKKSDLEAAELYGIKKIRLFYSDTNIKANNTFKKQFDITFQSDRGIDNSKIGVLISDFTNSKVQYYKTVTDNENTYIYFILENTTNEVSMTFKMKKVLINGEVLDASDISKKVYSNTKSLMFITVPKSLFPNVKTFTVSFFNIVENSEGQKSYYISKEYTKEI